MHCSRNEADFQVYMGGKIPSNSRKWYISAYYREIYPTGEQLPYTRDHLSYLWEIVDTGDSLQIIKAHVITFMRAIIKKIDCGLPLLLSRIRKSCWSEKKNWDESSRDTALFNMWWGDQIDMFRGHAITVSCVACKRLFTGSHIKSFMQPAT